MASTPDTLTAQGALVTLGVPDETDFGGHPGYTYTQYGYAALPGRDEVGVVWEGFDASGKPANVAVAGFGLDGGVYYAEQLVNVSGGTSTLLGAPSIAPQVRAYAVVAWSAAGSDGRGQITSDVVTWFGGINSSQPAGHASYWTGQGAPTALQTPEGYRLEWNAYANTVQPSRVEHESQRYSTSGGPIGGVSESSLMTVAPYTFAAIDGGQYLEVKDNIAQFHTSSTSAAPAVTVPGQPAHAITTEDAANLANGTIALAWASSGTDYVSLFNPATNSFGPAIGLDWGGADNVHTVALTDGGFAVSWTKGGQYKGELFTADGVGGGILDLTGDFANTTLSGGLYTVGLNSSGAYVVQQYLVNGSSGTTGGGGGTVRTSDANYVATDDVTYIILTGSNQTVTANNYGDTITSDNTVNHLNGGTGADTFHLGRGGDVATGGAGNDIFDFAQTPWNGGHITDFAIGDKIDLTGLLAASGYNGGDAVAAGYLKLTTDSGGNGQIWSNLNQPGNDGWWLVTSVDGVGASDLQIQGGVITHTPAPGSEVTVSTADANYQAPAGVTKIILTGSNQTVTGNDGGDTFVSTNTVNHLNGGTGADTFHLGRGGDVVTGGAGFDTFAFAEVPWNSGHITAFDLNEDRIDLTAMLAKEGYTGSDPVADGYLRLVDFVASDWRQTSGGQIWTDPHDGTGPWMVEMLDGVSVSALKVNGGVITGGGDGHVDDPYAYYSALKGVTQITLTGSNPSSRQTVNANDAGQTIIDNDIRNNSLTGGSGNDTFVIHSAGAVIDSVQAGNDTIVFTTVPQTVSYVDYFTPGSDRIDVRGLLQAEGYTGTDPFADGYLKLASPSAHQQYLMTDPDGPGTASTWVQVAYVDAVNYAFQLHYANGWLY